MNSRALLRTLLSLLLSAAVLASAQQAPKGPERWEPEIAAFDKLNREHPPEKGGIVFVGSSSIRLWKTLEQDFAGLPVVNRGFGGSEIADSVHFADRLVFPHAPRLVVLYAGGNDINSGKTAEQVFSDFQAFAGTVHAGLPETELAYISIAPNPARWAQVDRIKEANARIEAFCGERPWMKFINVFPHMLGPDGLPRPEIFSPDRLHMNAEGYRLWTGLVRPCLGRD